MAQDETPALFMILAPATPSNRRNSEASLLPFEDGRLLAAWSDFYASESADEGPSRIRARWSENEGASWGEPFILQENIGRLNCMSASLLRLASGRILLAFGRKDGQPGLAGGPAILHAMVKWSDDGGKTWCEPRDITKGDDYWCMTNDRLVQLSSGRILYPIGSETAGSHVWYSDDGGESWRMSRGNIPAKPGLAYAEPTVVERADGKVAMYIRNRAGNLHVAMSGDGGETWRPHKMHGPDMAGHPECGPASAEAPCMVKRVPGSADLLLIWNNHRVRTPLTAAISSDGGETWGHLRDLEPMTAWPPKVIHTYPSLTFLNGHAHLTYGHVEVAWREEPEKLKIEAAASLRYRRLPIGWFYAKA